jgi:parvulin-like peptidyl-prolyl isomerase
VLQPTRARRKPVRPLRGLCLLAALAVVPALAGCDTSPGAAALVGSHRISVSTVQNQVNAALANKSALSALGGSRAAASREILGFLISVDLVNAAATSRHVTVTPSDVSSETASLVQQAGGTEATLKQQAAQGGVSALELPTFIRYRALQQKLGTALAATLPATPTQLKTEYRKDINNFDQLDIAQITVATKSLAQTVLAKAKADPSAFAVLAKQYSTDSSAASGGEVGLVGRKQVLSALGTSAAQATPGSILLIHNSGQFVIVHVISRQVQPISEVTSQLKAALFSSQTGALLQKLVTTEGTKLGVHVSPRYGHWDPTTQTVVAAKNKISQGSSPSAAPSTPTG